jgi:hypothetical protein
MLLLVLGVAEGTPIQVDYHRNRERIRSYV